MIGECQLCGSTEMTKRSLIENKEYRLCQSCGFRIGDGAITLKEFNEALHLREKTYKLLGRKKP